MGSRSTLERGRLWPGRRGSDHHFCDRTLLSPRSHAHRSSTGVHRRLPQRITAYTLICAAICAAWLAAGCGLLRADKLSFDERVEINRGLMAEYAKSKVTLPRAKKPLSLPSDGNYDRQAWQKALLENGPAARVGDEVQITRVLIEDKKILLEINGGMKSGRHWYDHVEVGMGGGMAPVNQNQSGQA